MGTLGQQGGLGVSGLSGRRANSRRSSRRAGLPVWVRKSRFAPSRETSRVLAADHGARRGGADDLAARAVGEIVEVVGERPLTVEEVVARHQAAAARQRDAVRRLISSGSMVVTFQVPGLAAPMTLTSDVVVYEDGAVARDRAAVRPPERGGVRGEATGAPRLPLLEPERVSAPPLAITLDAAYRYRLHGRETAEGQRLLRGGLRAGVGGPRPLFRGRAWIEARGFAMVRTEAVQTGLRGPIVSSEQRDVFTAVPVADGVAWLPARSEIHQVYEGPGHRTPIDRIVTLTRLEPNPADFAARRAAAHASSLGDGGGHPGGPTLPAPDARGRRRPARREAAGPGYAACATLAAGVLVDPNISRPLPFAGLGYVDFDFLGTGAQVNGFFGGVFAQLAWTVPSLGGSRWQAPRVGLRGSRLLQRPGLRRRRRALRREPAAAAGEDRRGRGAAPLGAGARARRLRARLHAPGARRDHGRGLRGAGQPRRARCARGDRGPGRLVGRRLVERCAPPAMAGLGLPRLEAGKRWLPAVRRLRRPQLRPLPAVGGRLDGAWMGGWGLDRFSRYAFDGFENRLRGYPTATVRYDRGAVAGVVTWNAARRLRLDGFLDVARVRDPGRGPRSRTYIGVGAALEAPLPLRALAASSGVTASRPAVPRGGPAPTSSA